MIERSERMKKPTIAITMGDPCGIGPEVIVKGLLEKKLYTLCRPFVIGDARRISEAAGQFAPGISIRTIKTTAEARFREGVLEVLEPAETPLPPMAYGQPHPEAARAALQAITRGAEMALRGEIDGITTAPINKEGMKAIGFAFPGHTEFLADIAKSDRFAMMMVGGGLKITLTTIHLSLRDAITQLRKEKILDAIRLTDAAMKKDFGIERPRIAVTALNPHAGERGIFGDEEKREVLPAVDAAGKEEINVFGPFPADTLFYQLKTGRFDAAVALFHDQALIPIKLLAFGNAINVTIGLPFIRTSVDHGTAYDIAGKGIADPGSLQEALKLAAEMARFRTRR
ncbi:MAG: 4-hydroxythreonine-4-phosphate dehydrogenase PdxA [Candidatus Manganitrophaceae bacterium]|nr:MAG: 4-hydroxythreonine-4-phosphate dehydrogenase PdxA [Candidatus Manganitrophaceae bacterium]